MVMFSYLRGVLVRFKYLLGGGSLLLILTGIIERFTSHSVTWSVYTWLLVACFVVALVTDGVHQYKRLLPRMAVDSLARRVWSPVRVGFTGVEFYFEVRNLSESDALDGVRVELIDVDPKIIEYLPVPLHIKHDSYEIREFSINAGSTRQIDLVTGPINDPLSQGVMIIAHTVNTERQPVPLQEYKLTVRVSAKNAPPVLAYFNAWLDQTGELRCIML